MNKSQLRRKYKELRAQLSEAKRDEFSLEIANKTLELDIWERTYYHLFLTIGSQLEINTDYLLHILQGRDKSVVVPKAEFSTGEMTHYLLQENTKLQLSNYNIPEPMEGIVLPASQMDVVFIPLLAFDHQGNRVGYGKGFYDRFLAQCSEQCLFVGLSFFPAEENIEANDTDVPLHFCITPDRIYSF